MSKEMTLRPLGIGEIFDRAVTIYVRNFAVFAIIAAFVIIPLESINYFMIARQGGMFTQILDQIQHPGKTPPVAGAFFGLWFLMVTMSALLTPFMYVAMAAALGRIYKGEAADWRAAYGLSFRHTGGIILTVICQIFIIFGAIIVGMVPIGFAFGIAAALVTFVPPLGVVAMIVAALLLLPYVVVLMLCYLAMALAFDAIGIEEVSFGRAIGSSLARIFNKKEIGKATLMCLAFLAVQFGMFAVAAALSGLVAATINQPLLQTAISAVISLTSTGFIGVLLAVYYFDVRIRREGLDMVTAIDRLAPEL